MSYSLQSIDDPFKGDRNTLNAFQNLNDFELHLETLQASSKTSFWGLVKEIVKIDQEER